MKGCKKIALVLAALALLTAVLAIGIAAEDKPALDIYAANLSFEDSVYLMYAVDAENVSADQVKMLFWTAPILEGDPDAYVKGTEDYVGTNCGDVTIKDSTYKMFKYDKLHAKNMTDVIYARAYVEVDGVCYYSELSKYSILQYAYNKLGYTGTASTSSKLKAMLNAMLTYGTMAQEYFAYNTDRLATDSFYQIKLEGGVLSDGCAHGLYLAGEEVTVTANIENFACWKDAFESGISTDVVTTVTVAKVNATYTASDTAVSPDGPGLEFALNDDGESYSVTGIGSCTDTDIIIPATYEGKPVTSIGGWAFFRCSNLTSVTIPDSVTSIGSSAFYNCSSLTSVTIPDSVTTIGDWAFDVCYRLVEVINKSTLNVQAGSSENGYVAYYAKEVHTGESKLISVGDYLFYTYNGVHYLVAYTGSDTSVTLPASYNGDTYEINQYAFYNCSSLTSVTIPDSVTSIGRNAFYNCRSLTSVTIGDSVTSIGKYAFSDCSSLASIAVASGNPAYHSNGNCLIETASKTLIAGCKNSVIPTDGSVTSIGYGAFAHCSNLTSVTIPDSVTSIGNYAFSSCSSLTSVTIPDSVTSIGSYAFYGCSSLTSVTIPDSVTSIGNYAFYDCSSLTSITIPDSVTSIGEYAFYGCSSLTSVTIGNGVTSIGSLAFSGCFRLVEVINKSTLNVRAGRSENGYVAYYAKEVHTGESKLISVGDYLFYTYNGVHYLVAYTGSDTSVTLPASYNGDTYEINQHAFRGCSSLASIIIPDSVTSIGNYAFYGCSSLTSVNIPDSVTTIGYYAFYGCTGLTSVTIPDSVTSIGGAAFEGCSSLTSVTIPDSVTSIGDGAFYNCSSLTSVTIPDSVTSIGDRAFYYCNALETVHIKNMDAWCRIAFANANANPMFHADQLLLNGEPVKHVVIPEGVTEIKYTFYGFSDLESVTIPDSVTSIGYGAFRGCSSLTSVTIPDSVTSIGDDAFYGCYRLVEVINKSTLNVQAGSSENGYVAYYAKEVHTGESKLISVGDYLFYTYDGIHYLVAYTGSDTSVTLPASYNGDTYEINQYAFRDCRNLTSVTIPDSVTSIGEYAFYGCNALETVHIKNMDAWCRIAFANANANPMFYADQLLLNDEPVKHVVIPEGVTEIKYTFYGFSDLESVTIPDSVTSIGNRAFHNCSSLTSVTIPDSVTSIGSSAFSGCSSLASIAVASGNPAYHSNGNCLIETASKTLIAGCKNSVIPTDGSVTSIGDGAFYNCSSLTSVTIGNSVTSIGSSAFSGCTGLTSIPIPNSVTSIGDWAFSGCTGLTSIPIPNSVTSIGDWAFYGCSSLTSVYYGGTAEQWASDVTIGINNDPLTSATRYYYSETAPTEAGNYWHYVDGKVEIWSSGDAENEPADDVVSDPI